MKLVYTVNLDVGLNLDLGSGVNYYPLGTKFELTEEEMPDELLNKLVDLISKGYITIEAETIIEYNEIEEEED